MAYVWGAVQNYWKKTVSLIDVIHYSRCDFAARQISQLILHMMAQVAGVTCCSSLDMFKVIFHNGIKPGYKFNFFEEIPTWWREQFLCVPLEPISVTAQ